MYACGRMEEVAATHVRDARVGERNAMMVVYTLSLGGSPPCDTPLQPRDLAPFRVGEKTSAGAPCAPRARAAPRRRLPSRAH